jgi:hypothetical protein
MSNIIEVTIRGEERIIPEISSTGKDTGLKTDWDMVHGYFGSKRLSDDLEKRVSNKLRENKHRIVDVSISSSVEGDIVVSEGTVKLVRDDEYPDIAFTTRGSIGKIPKTEEDVVDPNYYVTRYNNQVKGLLDRLSSAFNGVARQIGSFEITISDSENTSKRFDDYGYNQSFFAVSAKKGPSPQSPSPQAASNNTTQQPATKTAVANTPTTAEDSGFIDFNSYKKNYVILTSDRLILNSKDDSVFIASKKHISLSAVEQVHIDVGPLENADPSKNYFIVNSPMIQFGLPANYNDRSINQPVAKGRSTIEFVNSLIKAIDKFCNSLIPASGLGVGVIQLPEISAAANVLKTDLNQSLKNYGNTTSSPILSKITNTV